MAKKAALVEVKVLNRRGEGATSWVAAGLDWAAKDCREARGGAMCVVSMSVGSPKSKVLDDAVTRAYNAGLVVVVAGGNSGGDACKFSPSGAAAAVAVGATTRGDGRAGFSNWGGCVDLYAPGVGIKSSWPKSKCPRGNPSCYKTESGTSMAAPHVAGVAAIIWSQLGPSAGAADVVKALTAAATPGVVSGARGTADHPPLLAFNRLT